MASKMSVFLVAAITVALLAIWYINTQKEEGFQTQGYSVNELDINTCPPSAPEIQTAKGSTDCCTGDLIDGKCNGTTFCTKSPAYPGVPACVDKWRSYFTDKGLKMCPPSMPNYYENILNAAAPKGCSAGPIVPDGTMPKDGSRPQCKIYASDLDNKSKPNSCYLEKQRARIQCPVVNGRSPEAVMISDRVTNKFQMFSCQYPFELGIPDRCYEKNSFFQFVTTMNPNWRTNAAATRDVNNQICENYIQRRNAARDEQRRLEEERRKREAAEKAAREWQNKWNDLWARWNRRQTESSRLQQQLDEANRRLQNCRR